jgi:hypothetical protein
MLVNMDNKKSKLKNKRNLILLGLIILTLVVIFILLSSLSTFYVPGITFYGCSAESGYLCQNATYNNLTGNLTVILGQGTGINWTSASIVFVPFNIATVNGVPNISFGSNSANVLYADNGLSSRQIVSITLPVSGPVNVNTSTHGTIWAEYRTEEQPDPEYTKIAIVSIKAS